MDFKSLKEKAVKLKEKAAQKTNDAIDYGAKKLTNSKFTIVDKKNLEAIIDKSKNTKFMKKDENNVEKEITYTHRSIVIFAEEGSVFFKKALYVLPIIFTKAYSQNISVKLAKSKIEGIKLEDYKIDPKNLPTLVIFENTKVLKTIQGDEKILKLVKSFDLNINKLIDEV